MNEKSDNNNSKELKAIAKGGAFVSLGRLSGRLFRFLLIVMVVRLITKADFGVISLAYVVMSIGATISLLGMGTGLPRFIARTRGRHGDNSEEVGKIIGTCVVFVLTMALLSSSILYAASGHLSELFDNSRLLDVFQVFAFLLLPMIGVQLVSSIFQGLERSLPRFIFQDVLMHVMRIALVVPLFLLDDRFLLVVWAYVASAWITFIVAVIYSLRTMRGHVSLAIDAAVLKELINFSLPLFGITLVINSTAWIGTLLLGLWATSGEVASYTVALRLAEVLTLGIVALGFIFMPMATRAVARGENEKLIILYASTTKWVTVLSLPLLLFFVFDAIYIIPAIFSRSYIDAVPIIQILSAGYFVHIVLGLNGSTLLAYGESVKVFMGSLLYGVITAIFAIFLTKPLGGIGVAIAVSSGLVAYNIYLSYVLYKHYNVPPLSRGSAKPLFIAIIAGGIAAIFCTSMPVSHPLFHAGILIVLYLITLTSLLLSGGLDHSDMVLLGALERKLTGSDKTIKRLVKNG